MTGSLWYRSKGYITSEQRFPASSKTTRGSQPAPGQQHVQSTLQREARPPSLTFLFLANLLELSEPLFSESSFFPAGGCLSSGFLGRPPLPGSWGIRERRSRVIFTIKIGGGGVSLSGDSSLGSLAGPGSLSFLRSSWTTTARRQPLVLPPPPPPPWGGPWLWVRGTRAKCSGLLAPALSFVGSGPESAFEGASGVLLCFFRSLGLGAVGLGSLLSPARGLPFVFTLGLSLEGWSLEPYGGGPGSLSTCRPARESAWAEALTGFLGCLVPTVCLGGGSC